MNKTPFRRTRVAGAIAGLACALGAGHAFGAAFALQETCGSGLGNAYAGGAAAAEDACTVWSNPAGMSRFSKNQVVGATEIITPSFKFQNGNSQPALNQPLGNNGGDAGSTVAVPNVYLVMPINNQWAFGVGFNVPFGLVTDYDSGWLGRYQATRSSIKTMNVSPVVSYKFNDAFSLGVGADWQHISASFGANVNYSAALLQAAGVAAQQGLIPPALVPVIGAATPGLDANSTVEGSDSAWSWNIGALWNLSPDTRIGAQYRGSMKYHITGTVSFTYPQLPSLPPALAPVVGLLAANVNNAIPNGGITSDIKLPDSANISFFTRLNPQWDLMADAQWVHWSTIENLTFTRTTGAQLASTPENFRDTWRLAAGTNYHLNDQWLLRGGFAWDQSPVRSQYRTPRLPDNDRYWLTIGAQYAFNKDFKLDGGFGYLWISNPDINQNAGSTAAYGLINGHYSANVNIFSVQLTYSF